MLFLSTTRELMLIRFDLYGFYRSLAENTMTLLQRRVVCYCHGINKNCFSLNDY